MRNVHDLTSDELAVLELARPHGFDHWNMGGNCTALVRQVHGHFQCITYDDTASYDGPLASDGFILTQAPTERWHYGENDVEAFGNPAHLIRVANRHAAALCIGLFLSSINAD